MLFIRLMKNSNIFGCPKKCHTFLTAHDFCLARSSHLKFVYNSNQTCFTHEYKISLKLINYEKMVGLWNWYLFFGEFCVRANGAHNFYALLTELLQSHYFNLETNSFRMSISLTSELVSTIPGLTLLGKYRGHEW